MKKIQHWYYSIFDIIASISKRYFRKSKKLLILLHAQIKLRKNIQILNYNFYLCLFSKIFTDSYFIQMSVNYKAFAKSSAITAEFWWKENFLFTQNFLKIYFHLTRAVGKLNSDFFSCVNVQFLFYKNGILRMILSLLLLKDISVTYK